MRDLIGRTLGHYRIVELIGEGGMGEVYRAHDERLDRDVAVKVLPEEVANKPDRLTRFEREAKAVAKLDHPNILAIHDFGTEEGVTYVVTELLEGESLRDRIPAEGMGWQTVTEIGAAAADGLAAAHGKGVIHRDLKPENIYLTADGRVKILDFGLAQIKEPVDEDAETATLTPAGTLPGTVMGTMGYMSPEQLRGQSVDSRSDIFALSCVLYEMLGGEAAFRRGTTAEISAAILKEDPCPLTDSGVTLPTELDRTVRRCLEKSAEARFQSASDLAFNLRAILTAPTPVATRDVPRAGDRRKAIAWTAIGFVIVVAVVLVVIVGVNALGLRNRLFGGAGGPVIDSLAVLPLQNLSGDPEQEYFADGMTEALITDLAQIRALKVISRTSAFRFKDTDQSLEEIARELGVDAIVEGSVLRAGDRVRITAQLIHASTDQHLWARSYDRDLRDILTLQSEVAQAVAHEIRVAVTSEEEEALTRARPVNPEALEAYLRGRHHWRKFTAEGYNRAIAYFEEAIEIDPSYAPAHAVLASSYLFLAGLTGFMAPGEAAPKVKQAALRALELDDTLAEARASLAGAMYRMDWDWIGAEREYKRAIGLNPNSAYCRHHYSYYLMSMGRLDDAIAEMRRALELSPLELLSNTVLGFFYSVGNRFEEAMRQIEKTIELDPSYNLAYFNLGIIHLHQADYDRAIVELQKARALSGDNPAIIPDLARALVEAGREDEAFELVRELEARAERDYVSPGVMAWLYAGLGNKDEAFEWLETAYEERSWEMAQLKLDRHFDLIRDDPRFQNILRRMNFPEN